ncbi:DUF6479 family protein [Streptomyces sp. NPDC046332]|uniref:DUF6479 family protein n=1 Tax=Streptomyces sp. NPDC046332 TaxID=3155133 RepID=UPI0033F584DF
MPYHLRNCGEASDAPPGEEQRKWGGISSGGFGSGGTGHGSERRVDRPWTSLRCCAGRRRR